MRAFWALVEGHSGGKEAGYRPELVVGNRAVVLSNILSNEVGDHLWEEKKRLGEERFG